jgi:hypothetical protein
VWCAGLHEPVSWPPRDAALNSLARTARVRAGRRCRGLWPFGKGNSVKVAESSLRISSSRKPRSRVTYEYPLPRQVRISSERYKDKRANWLLKVPKGEGLVRQISISLI